jgi:hypothetical protein
MPVRPFSWLRPLSLIAAVLLCATASAGELLVVGQVESILLQANDAPACPGTSPGRSSKASHADGSVTLGVSNACGCQQTRVRIAQTLLGGQQGALAVIDTPLGEWCRPTLPLDEKPILIHVNGDSMSWSPLTQRDGAWWFSPKALGTVAGVDWKAIVTDSEGLAPVDRLLDQTGGVPR